MKVLFAFISFIIFIQIGFSSAQDNQLCRAITTKETELDGLVMDVYWVLHPQAPDDMEPVVFIRTSRYSIYRSTDGGATWVSQRDFVGSVIYVFIRHEDLDDDTEVSNGTTIYFQGIANELWYTGDLGETYVQTDNGLRLQNILIHPKNSDWLLAGVYTDKCITPTASGECYQQLVLSQDSGWSWRVIEKYVYQFTWGNAGDDEVPDKSVWILDWREKNGYQYYKKREDLNFRRSDTFFTEEYNHTVLPYEDIIFMLHYNKNTYLAQMDRSDGGLRLLISEDNGKSFNYANFPFGEVREDQYTILDDSYGSVFINVRHGNSNWGNLYVSGKLGTDYDLSLPYNSRDGTGRTEFRRLEGLDGVYIANQRISDGNKTINYFTNRRSVITYDIGGEWKRLSVPLDQNGSPIPCNDTECNLNVHGTFKRTGITYERYGPIYSNKNAIGLMMATGNQGRYLIQRDSTTNTYFSRDGGHTWYFIRNGSHLYEFADHGSLIMMIRNRVTTSKYMFSWNEALDFTECDLTQGEPILVNNIGIDPQLNSQKFLVHGTRLRSNNTRVAVIVQVDFTGLHTRNCSDNDYESWSPRGSDETGLNCVLGQNLIFRRRKREAACFNGDKFEPLLQRNPCPCTRDDLECDQCYELQEDETCVLDTDDNCTVSSGPPMVCRDTYTVSKGYRYIPATKCDPNLQGSTVKNFLPTVLPCPGVSNVETAKTTDKPSVQRSSSSPSKSMEGTGSTKPGNIDNGSDTSSPQTGGLSSAGAVGVSFVVILLIAAIIGAVLAYLVKKKGLDIKSIFNKGKSHKKSSHFDQEASGSLLEDY